MNKEEKDKLVKDRFIKIRQFKQYKDKTDDEVLLIARKSIERSIGKTRKEEEIKSEGIWQNIEEAKEAEKLFETYKQHCHIEKKSEENLLHELVYLEIIAKRYKKAILSKSQQKGQTEVSPNLVEGLQSTLDKIVAMQKMLFGDKNEKDPYEYIKILEKKFKLYREKHQKSFESRCPHCSQMIRWKHRIDNLEGIPHPFFKGAVLYNEHALKLMDEGKISALDAAKILQGTDTRTADYIDWLIKHGFFIASSHKQIQEESVQNMDVQNGFILGDVEVSADTKSVEDVNKSENSSTDICQS